MVFACRVNNLGHVVVGCSTHLHGGICANDRPCSMHDQLAINLKSTQCHLGFIVGSPWGHLGIILGSSWDHSGFIL